MSDVFNEESQQLEQSYSRRKLFKWLGLVSAGASLAALGLANPTNALAASESTCNPATCNSCEVTLCAVHNTCPSQPSILVYYTVMTCTSSGCQPVKHAVCKSSCSCP
jgi:hypothetical protein